MQQIKQAIQHMISISEEELSQFLSLRTVPRWAKVRIMNKVMSGFTQHQR